MTTYVSTPSTTTVRPVATDVRSLETSPRSSCALGEVLVTGATGFIGKNLLARLHQEKSSVHAVVRTGGSGRLPSLPGLKVREFAMDSYSDWHTALQGIGTVIHLAGATAGTASELYEANRDLTRRIAHACSEQERPPHLVLVSSLSAAGPSPKGRPRSPRDAAAPVSEYGRSKYEGEVAALAYSDRVPITILRPGIVFGPGDRELVRLLDPIAKLGINPMAGFHDPEVAFIYVEDLIDAIFAAARDGRCCHGSQPSDGNGEGVYFVADPRFVTFSEFARLVAPGLGVKRVCNVRLPLACVKSVATMVGKLGEWMGWRTTFNADKIREAACAAWTCDVSSTQRELHWAPSMPLDARLHQFASMVARR